MKLPFYCAKSWQLELIELLLQTRLGALGGGEPLAQSGQVGLRGQELTCQQRTSATRYEQQAEEHTNHVRAPHQQSAISEAI